MSLQSLRYTFQQWWQWSFARAAGAGQGTASAVLRAGIQPGLYHFMHESAGEPTRFHLRVDSSGNGLLLAGASAAARLTPSGVILAKGLLDGDDERTLLGRLQQSFHNVPVEEAQHDIRRVLGLIDELAEPGDTYPIINLTDPTFTPQANPLDLPLSADIPMAEPDGAVIPARGPWVVGGNLLDDPWPRIHDSPEFQRYRARVEKDTHCENCPGLAICAADCPREPRGWADGRQVRAAAASD